MQTPVLFLIGPPGHGKTSARKILSALTSAKGGSTSAAIYSFLAMRSKTPVAELEKIPKEEFRAKLIEAGDFMCGAIPAMSEPTEYDEQVYRCPSILVRMLYTSGYNIIDGVRRKIELAHAKDHLDWNGVPSFTIWIEKSQGPVIADNTELTALDADETIFNDGTLEDLQASLLKFLQTRFGEQTDLEKEVPVLDSPEAAKNAISKSQHASAPARGDDLS